jgi:hypothetical protein
MTNPQQFTSYRLCSWATTDFLQSSPTSHVPLVKHFSPFIDKLTNTNEKAKLPVEAQTFLALALGAGTTRSPSTLRKTLFLPTLCCPAPLSEEKGLVLHSAAGGNRLPLATSPPKDAGSTGQPGLLARSHIFIYFSPLPQSVRRVCHIYWLWRWSRALRL